LRRGEAGNPAEVTEPDATPGLLTLLQDDIRQCRDALSGELKRLRGKIRPSLEQHREEEAAANASPESVKGADR